MKKFIALTLVLSMASVASAALLIGVEGDPDPVDSEITIAPSDTLLLDIRSDGDYAPLVMLIVENAYGTISGGSNPVGDNVVDLTIYLTYFAPSYPSYSPIYQTGKDPTLWNGIAWQLGGNLDASDVSGIILDQIDFHCEAPGDAVIELWEEDAPDAWNLVDTVIITQIPEPITLTLLGLGGLFLRRRK